MATNFDEAKRAIEAVVIMEANAVPIPHCVENTGDLVKVGDKFVDGFSIDTDWFIFKVSSDGRGTITVGNTLKRIEGSIFFTVYSPTGQASAGGAKITDFIYSNFQATKVENIILRDVRKMNEFELNGWSAEILRVSFQLNVT